MIARRYIELVYENGDDSSRNKILADDAILRRINENDYVCEEDIANSCFFWTSENVQSLVMTPEEVESADA